LVLDFDGTVTERDIGDEICDRFAPPAWRDFDAAWVRNEISLPEAQRRMWSLARCQEGEALAYARERGRLRPGLDALLDEVTRVGGASWLASGGFDFYIRAILGERLGRFERVFCNGARFIDGGVQVEFPYDRLACGRCAVCKGKVCEAAHDAGARVVFVGDGASDRCAIERADVLCAVEGSLLARTCEERRVPYVAFRDLADVVDAI
jgi:2,3-diketo-5-methylthio-1-phosphopentane phosphatase